MLMSKQTPLAQRLCWAQVILIFAVLITYLVAFADLQNNLEVKLSSKADGCESKKVLMMKESLRQYKLSPKSFDKYEIEKSVTLNPLNQTTTEKCFVAMDKCRPNMSTMEEESTSTPWVLIAAVFVWAILKLTFLHVRIARGLVACFQIMCVCWSAIIWDDANSQAARETDKDGAKDYRRGEKLRKKSDTDPKSIYTVIDINVSGREMQYIVKDEHGTESAIEPEEIEIAKEQTRQAKEDVLTILMSFAPQWKWNKAELAQGTLFGVYKGGLWAINKGWFYVRYKLAPNAILAILTKAHWHSDCQHVLITAGETQATIIGGILLFHLWIFSTACWFYSERYPQCARVREAGETGYVHSYIGPLPEGSSHSQYCGQNWNTGLIHLMICDLAIVFSWTVFSLQTGFNLFFIFTIDLRFDMSFRLCFVQLLQNVLSVLELVAFVQFVLIKDAPRPSSQQPAPALDVELQDIQGATSSANALRGAIADANKIIGRVQNAAAEPAGDAASTSAAQYLSAPNTAMPQSSQAVVPSPIYAVVVPPGVRPGDFFNAQVGDRLVPTQVPANVQPGSMLHIRV